MPGRRSERGLLISSDPIGLAGGLNTFAYALGRPTIAIDPSGLEVTMTCRPVALFGKLGLSKPVHCGVIVWHWEIRDCKQVKVIDALYSLPGGSTQPTTDPRNQTYGDDRNAFNNPGGNNTNYPIPVPPGMTQGQFDKAVTQSGANYSQGTYMPPGYGPNSNSAANNIIVNGGGTPPQVPGVWSQGQPAHSGDSTYTGPNIPWRRKELKCGGYRLYWHRLLSALSLRWGS